MKRCLFPPIAKSSALALLFAHTAWSIPGWEFTGDVGDISVEEGRPHSSIEDVREEAQPVQNRRPETEITLRDAQVDSLTVPGWDVRVVGSTTRIGNTLMEGNQVLVRSLTFDQEGVDSSSSSPVEDPALGAHKRGSVPHRPHKNHEKASASSSKRTTPELSDRRERSGEHALDTQFKRRPLEALRASSSQRTSPIGTKTRALGSYQSDSALNQVLHTNQQGSASSSKRASPVEQKKASRRHIRQRSYTHPKRQPPLSLDQIPRTKPTHPEGLLEETQGNGKKQTQIAQQREKSQKKPGTLEGLFKGPHASPYLLKEMERIRSNVRRAALYSPSDESFGVRKQRHVRQEHLEKAIEELENKKKALEEKKRILSTADFLQREGFFKNPRPRKESDPSQGYPADKAAIEKEIKEIDAIIERIQSPVESSEQRPRLKKTPSSDRLNSPSPREVSSSLIQQESENLVRSQRAFEESCQILAKSKAREEKLLKILR